METTCSTGNNCQWFKGDGKLSIGQCFPLASADTVALKSMCETTILETACDKSMCIWKAPVADVYHCAAVGVPTAADNCKNVVTKDGCTALQGTCEWTMATTDKPDDKIPLFSADFCHPVKVSKDTTKAIWNGCVASDTVALCAMAPGCNWSTGEELIPSGDFCAPMDLTTDKDLI